MKLADILDSNTAAGNLFYSEGFTYELDGYVEYSTNPETLAGRALMLNDRIVRRIEHHEGVNQYDIYFLDDRGVAVAPVDYDLDVTVVRITVEGSV